MRIAIIGAGLSGLTCARDLLRRGCDVEVFEARQFVGGRAATFPDRTGKPAEASLNVLAGSYRSVRRLLKALGAQEAVNWRDEEVVFAFPGGRTTRLQLGGRGLAGRLRGLIATDLLSLDEKRTLAQALLPALLSSHEYVKELDSQNVAQWARDHGLSESVLRNFIDPLSRAFNFLPPEEVSAATVVNALVVMARRAEAGRMGFLVSNASEILFDRLVAEILGRGGKIHLGTRVRSLPISGNRVVAAVDDGGREYRADGFVSCLLPDHLCPLLPAEIASRPPFEDLARIGSVPAVSVRFELDRRVILQPNLVYSTRAPLAVVCDVTLCRPACRRGETIVQAVLAPAEALMSRTDEQLVRMAWEALQDLYPAASTAVLLRAEVYRIAPAAYRARPGSEGLRPSSQTPVANLFLAGDYTHQGFPASLEGAAASGHRAARAVLAVE